MEKLTKILNERMTKSKYKEKLTQKEIKSVHPFNEIEYIISHLIAEKLITLDEYYQLRDDYIKRNKYLEVFGITAPRTFGETWAQKHLNDIVPELKKPDKKNDKQYNGEYDFWYDGIKIEVKASRAVKRGDKRPLTLKALESNSEIGFDMNFQQIKPRCCNVFVWIGVWKDIIRYWVLSSKEVEKNTHYSNGQHRGNEGEGQLWIKETNIKEFEKYLAKPEEILEKIIEKSKQ